MKTSIKYFPFSPGVPWKINNGKYITPHISNAVWAKSVESKDPIIVSNGGLLEAYFSLVILEMLNSTFINKKKYWAGNIKFKNLININGLASTIDTKIDNDILLSFPVPMFMDKINNIYFNVMCSYIEHNSFTKTNKYKNYKPLVKQLIDNSTQTWNYNFSPKMRNWGTIPNEISNWCKINKFNLSKPFILIMLDHTNSIHDKSCLGWSDIEIKALSGMLIPYGIQTLVFSNDMFKSYTNSSFLLKPNISWFLYMLNSASMILSESIDYLLISLMYSKPLVCKKLKNSFNIKANSKFLKSESVIYETNKLTPFYVFQKLTGKDD